MKQRGRKSAKSAEVVSIQQAKRPRPPADLTKTESELWVRIVGERAPDYFDSASQVLLAEYCRVKSQCDQLAVPIAKFKATWFAKDEGVARYKKLVHMQDTAQKRLLALATKMRLAQQSRYVPDHTKTRGESKAGPKPWEVDG